MQNSTVKNVVFQRTHKSGGTVSSKTWTLMAATVSIVLHLSGQPLQALADEVHLRKDSERPEDNEVCIISHIITKIFPEEL